MFSPILSLMGDTIVTIKTKRITVLRFPEDQRDYAAEFIRRSNHRFGSMEIYEQHRTELARSYCKDVNIHLILSEDDELIFDTTKNYDGGTK